MEIFNVYPESPERAQELATILSANRFSFEAKDDVLENYDDGYSSEQNARIHSKINAAVQNNTWDKLDDDEREDFVFGLMLNEIDRTKTVDTNHFLNELLSRI